MKWPNININHIEYRCNSGGVSNAYTLYIDIFRYISIYKYIPNISIYQTHIQIRGEVICKCLIRDRTNDKHCQSNNDHHNPNYDTFLIRPYIYQNKDRH